MKLKAVVTRTAPQTLIEGTNSSAVADTFRDRVAIAHLRVTPHGFGPATHYVQESDLSIPTSDGALGVEVTLSKVSTSWRRSGEMFIIALQAVQATYKELIENTCPVGTKVQLFCALALDDKVQVGDGSYKSLIELDPIWVEGMLAA